MPLVRVSQFLPASLPPSSSSSSLQSPPSPSSVIQQLPLPPTPTIKIMSRSKPKNSPPQPSSPLATDLDAESLAASDSISNTSPVLSSEKMKDRKLLTFEERAAAYLEARSRIFKDEESSSQPASVNGDSVNANAVETNKSNRPSSTSSGSDKSRTSGGSGITAETSSILSNSTSNNPASNASSTSASQKNNNKKRSSLGKGSREAQDRTSSLDDYGNSLRPSAPSFDPTNFHHPPPGTVFYPPPPPPLYPYPSIPPVPNADSSKVQQPPQVIQYSIHPPPPPQFQVVPSTPQQPGHSQHVLAQKQEPVSSATYIVNPDGTFQHLQQPAASSIPSIQPTPPPPQNFSIYLPSSQNHQVPQISEAVQNMARLNPSQPFQPGAQIVYHPYPPVYGYAQTPMQSNWQENTLVSQPPLQPPPPPSIPSPSLSSASQSSFYSSQSSSTSLSSQRRQSGNSQLLTNPHRNLARSTSSASVSSTSTSRGSPSVASSVSGMMLDLLPIAKTARVPGSGRSTGGGGSGSKSSRSSVSGSVSGSSRGLKLGLGPEGSSGSAPSSSGCSEAGGEKDDEKIVTLEDGHLDKGKGREDEGACDKKLHPSLPSKPTWAVEREEKGKKRDQFKENFAKKKKGKDSNHAPSSHPSPHSIHPPPQHQPIQPPQPYQFVQEGTMQNLPHFDPNTHSRQQHTAYVFAPPPPPPQIGSSEKPHHYAHPLPPPLPMSVASSSAQNFHSYHPNTNQWIQPPPPPPNSNWSIPPTSQQHTQQIYHYSSQVPGQPLVQSGYPSTSVLMHNFQGQYYPVPIENPMIEEPRRKNPSRTLWVPSDSDSKR